jgi:hypothetical protein
MTKSVVAVSCPHCRRVYRVSFDARVLSRISREVVCGRCNRRFNLVERLQAEAPEELAERHAEDRKTTTAVKPFNRLTPQTPPPRPTPPPRGDDEEERVLAAAAAEPPAAAPVDEPLGEVAAPVLPPSPAGDDWLARADVGFTLLGTDPSDATAALGWLLADGAG